MTHSLSRVAATRYVSIHDRVWKVVMDPAAGTMEFRIPHKQNAYTVPITDVLTLAIKNWIVEGSNNVVLD